MNIEYKTEKELPCDQLYQLFLAVGWATKESTTKEMIDNFNIDFLNSTFVFSAWMDDKLVGSVKVLSDLHFRSIIYDLAVLPEFQNKGIGSTLVQKCLNACKDSFWLVETDKAKDFYKKMGFKENEDFFLTMSSKWF